VRESVKLLLRDLKQRLLILERLVDELEERGERPGLDDSSETQPPPNPPHSLGRDSVDDGQRKGPH